jgi:hypothetical protein
MLIVEIGSKVKRAAIAFCIVLVLLIVWIALRWNAPPLRLVRSSRDIVVDVQTLGEYPTTVNRIRLSDLQSTVVWEVVTQRGTPQIHDFALKLDDNPALLEAQYGDYRVVTPNGADRFVLRKGVRYRIEVWGGSTVLRACNKTSFCEPSGHDLRGIRS